MNHVMEIAIQTNFTIVCYKLKSFVSAKSKHQDLERKAFPQILKVN
jgi:hypothetical protein